MITRGEMLMDSIWVKVALAGVVLVGALIGAVVLWPGGDSPSSSRMDRDVERSKTVYDTWEEDEARLRAKPNQETQTPTQEQPVAEQTTPPADQQGQTVQPTTPQPVTPQPVAAEPKYNFKPIDEIEEFEAQKIWNWIVQKRKMGRLPMLQYKEMTDKCRLMMERWPGTEYDFYARRTLGDIPERYWKMYNITEEERDLTRFEVPVQP